MSKDSDKKPSMGFFLFFIQSMYETIHVRHNRHVKGLVILRQILFTGYEALPLISVLALGIGGLTILQGRNFLENVGQGIWIHIILVTVVISELSGILTALVVIARSGTAISTELGNMKISRQIQLIESYGISPIGYLVVSRIIGVVISTVLLVIYFNVIAILGGWLFSIVFNYLDFRAFMNDFFSIIKFAHVFSSLLKSIIFGLIISCVCAYHGMSVSKASTEVPQRTIRAVVTSISAVILVDIFITWLVWFFLR